jgi:membrane-bound lytic murein transglycosylase D
MALRQPSRPLVGVWILAFLAGCSTAGTIAHPTHEATADPSPTSELWSGPKAPKQATSVPVVPVAVSPPPGSPQLAQPSAGLAVAVEQASTYYERGLQAMGRGDRDRAEWEFDVALEALQDGNLAASQPPHLRGTALPPALPSPDWASSLLLPQRPVVLPPGPSLDEQPPIDAPALLSPEDLDEAAGEKPEETTALPEPDTQKHDVPLIFNDQVRAVVYYLQNRKWGVVTRAFERASRYLPMMRQIFQEEGLPLDLLNLAFIESAVNPWATSRAKAAGIWQFMPSTGRLYGMRVDWWLDERRDPEKSTRGAAQYLKKLYEMFEDWPLALAAYNVGEGAIQNAIQRQKTRNFWVLRLPKETRLFVPAFMAMTIIAREPERYGFSPPPEAPVEIDWVTLRQPADLKVIAEVAGSSVEELRNLNPALIRWATPPDQGHFRLRIPAGRADAFLETLERIPPAQRISWIHHTVRKGETPMVIARRYGVDVQSVLDLNGLRKRQALKAGTALRIPPVPTPAFLVQAEKKESGRPAAGRGGRPATYTVRRGDTLDRIARAHAVSPEDLRQWNNLPRKGAPRPGQTLAVAPSRPTLDSGVGATAESRSTKGKVPARTYVVKRGDTLAGIARAHAVSPEDLRQWNGLSSKAPIRPGQELRVGDPAS